VRFRPGEKAFFLIAGSSSLQETRSCAEARLELGPGRGSPASDIVFQGRLAQAACMMTSNSTRRGHSPYRRSCDLWALRDSRRRAMWCSFADRSGGQRFWTRPLEDRQRMRSARHCGTDLPRCRSRVAASRPAISAATAFKQKAAQVEGPGRATSCTKTTRTARIGAVPWLWQCGGNGARQWTAGRLAIGGNRRHLMERPSPNSGNGAPAGAPVG